MVNRLFIFIKLFLLPILFGFLWFFLTIILNVPNNFTVLQYSANPSTDFINTNYKEIHKGEKINGVFYSRDNNLGIVAIRFNTYGRINKDKLIFRIKEKGANNWYYENAYKVDQFQPNNFFTFGFPIIKDSKDKIYIFQLESTKGKKKDAVAISNISPIFLMKYQYPKQELLSNRTRLIFHLWQKFKEAIGIDYLYLGSVKLIFTSTNSAGLLISSLIYALPLIFYILWYYPWKLPKEYEIRLSLIFITIVLLLSINVAEELGSLVATIMLLVLWVMIVIRYHLESTVTFFYAIVFLLLIPANSIIKHSYAAERSAYYLYYFLGIGAIFSFLEMNKLIKTGTLGYYKLIKLIKK